MPRGTQVRTPRPSRSIERRRANERRLLELIEDIHVIAWEADA
jgi:hypothetical protein